MQFKTFACLVALVATHVGATTQALKAESVVTSIQKITNITSTLDGLFKNAKGAGIVKVAPKVTGQLKRTATMEVQEAVRIERAGYPKLPEDGQKDVCNAYSDLVKAQQSFLQTLISVNSTLSRSPFFATFAAILPDVENYGNELEPAISRVVPVCAEDVTKGKADLDSILAKAIKIYQPRKDKPF